VKRSVTKVSVTKVSVAKHSVAKRSVSKHSVAKRSVAKHSVANQIYLEVDLTNLAGDEPDESDNELLKLLAAAEAILSSE
jgi:hypothetical protein